MNGLELNPDVPLLQWGPVVLNRTLLYTWLVIGLLAAAARTATQNISPVARLTRLQNALEVIVSTLRQQIREIGGPQSDEFLPFVGTLFLFLVTCHVMTVVPGFVTPTGSLSTAAAFAVAVFCAVPYYGIRRRGLKSYLKQYLQPTVLMLPFNIIGEISRTLALAVRLYGNMLSGAVLAGLLLSFVPLFVPILMQLFGLLTGIVQAYIFSVLAMVYIASAVQTQPSAEGSRADSPPKTVSPDTH